MKPTPSTRRSPLVAQSVARYALVAAFSLVFVGIAATPTPADAQTSKAKAPEKDGSSQVRGKRPARDSRLVEVRGRVDQSMNAKKFQLNLKELPTTLNKQVELKRAPFPKNWETLTEEARVKWITEYENSDAGKKFIAANKKRLDDAPVFSVRFNPNGEFVVYDVPAGIYGLQGRVDKEIDGISHAFEVFGEISIDDQFDEVVLDPLPVVVTPVLQSGKPAPPVKVATYNGKATLSLDNRKLKDKFVFLNFWSTADYAPDDDQNHQVKVQAAIGELQKKYPIALLSVCLDEDRSAAVKHVMEKKYKNGLHGFTSGWDHETVNLYGVRSTPSGWLIAPDRTIAMSQYELYSLSRQKPSLAEVISDRIDGKDKPTPAQSDAKKE